MQENKICASRPFRPFRRTHGGALVETAIVLTLIISVTMGSIQYGYAFYLKHALQQAASAAARVAVMPNATDTQVQTAATNHLSSAGFSSLSATITTSPASVNSVAAGTYVTVTVSASWSRIGFNPLPTYLGGFPSNRTFTGSMTMLHE